MNGASSFIANAILDAYEITGDEKYERFAVTVLKLVSAQARRYPPGFGRVFSALEFYLAPTKEIVVLGEKGNDLEREIWREFLPNKIVVLAESDENAAIIPLLENRKMIDGKPTAYVCENFVCRKPVTDSEDLRRELL